MQAVILAAGLGRRLGKLTEHSTKCMVYLNGKRLIEYTLDACLEAGIARAVVVIGHGGEEVKQFVGAGYKGMPVTYVENPDYGTTNNIYSLLLATRQMAQDDTVVIESDVVFEPAILKKCVQAAAPNLAVVARFQPWMDGTMAVLDGAGRISRFVSKSEFRWSESETYYKTVNIYKLSRSFLTARFLPFLETYARTSGRNAFYEEVLRLLLFIGESEVAGLPVDGKRWYEIDDPNDLDIASTMFAASGARLRSLESRYGGYWRYPEVRDFCYLVNPYFPTPQLWQEMSRSLIEVTGRYPSGMRVQRLLAGRLLGLDPAQTAVGNGASELIAALMMELGPEERIGVVLPTFEEYRRCAGAGRLAEFQVPAPSFSYSAVDLISFCRREGVTTMVLINPDNPSGHFMNATSVERLAKELDGMGARLVLDESFVDFAGEGLCCESTLDAYSNLIVLKSISKSYGVPGLRLGVLASGDRSLVDRIAGRLPIWNVNSQAEHFLQVMGKYEDAYRGACRALIAERERLFEGLQAIPFLRPLPSSANYVLCEVLNGMTGRALAERLLEKHDVLIKDCSGKRGLEGVEYVRIAVRDEADDDYLLGALRAL
jgi:histidinol-phosphate/aromatic aminotransferase/cobyric acid decarboxylase-like protein/choline kinase